MTEMNNKTKTYYIGDNFYVDILEIPLNDYYESWIYHESYGIKDLMFRIPTEKQTYDEFIEIVRNNLNEYICSYVDDHFSQEERREFYAKNNYLQSK